MDEIVAGGAGVPDEWARIWTPHRMAYIRGENRPTSPGAEDGCPFCRIVGLPDDEALIIHRSHAAYVVLNLYPYNSGHLLICTYRHVADYTDLTDEEVQDIAHLSQTAMKVLREASNAQGFNIGINQGSIAGAGIAGHLHQHVVPRWGGDANFMPIIGRAKPLPALLSQTRELLVRHWPSV